MKLQKRDKLLFIGDSITDAERSPEGEGLFAALGKGYVAQVDALLGVAYADLGVRIVNKGCAGNNVVHLQERWQRDVLDLRPDWLSICIGINDVWRQYDLPHIPEQHVYIERYEAVLDALVTKTRPTLKGLVLMAPFYMEPNTSDAMRQTMDRYGAVVKQIAAKHDALFVDTQAAFDDILRFYYPATLGWDRVHPNHVGTMAIARAFLQAIGFDWERSV